jgi:hypothetical protein
MSKPLPPIPKKYKNKPLPKVPSQPSRSSRRKAKRGKGKGVLSGMSRAGLAAVSGAANSFFPGSGNLIDHLGKALLNKLGLSEKVALPSDYGGGQGGVVVASADAPVAFGRDEIPSSKMTVLHRAGNGDIIVHCCETLRDIQTNAVANTQTLIRDLMYPVNPSFVLLRQIGLNYQNYRVLGGRVHYTHFAATSEVARVSLAYADAPEFNFGSAPTFGQLSRMEEFMCGSAYEDFALTFEPTPSKNWWQSYGTAASGGTDDIVQGLIMTSIDMNANVNKTIGTLFLETVTAFKKTRSPDVTVALHDHMVSMFPQAPKPWVHTLICAIDDARDQHRDGVIERLQHLSLDEWRDLLLSQPPTLEPVRETLQILDIGPSTVHTFPKIDSRKVALKSA